MPRSTNQNLCRRINLSFPAIHGRVAAKARGVRFGRPPKLTGDQIALARRLVSDGTSIPEASKILKVHRTTLYRALHS
jgi:DNA invertase Pin-like site-specific DNA recombinase